MARAARRDRKGSGIMVSAAAVTVAAANRAYFHQWVIHCSIFFRLGCYFSIFCGGWGGGFCLGCGFQRPPYFVVGLGLLAIAEGGVGYAAELVGGGVVGVSGWV